MDFSVVKEQFADVNFDNKDFKRDVIWLVKDLPNKINSEEKQKLSHQIKRLYRGTPLAYVMGYVPFLNCKIFVNKNTLIPRQETELLVDIIIKQNKINSPKTLDLCAGSGCIGIALAKELNAQTTCVEISDGAIKMIKKNAKENGVQVNIIKSDMFENVSEKFDLIVSNPPYIPTNEIPTLDKSVKDFEPTLALDGGKSGLDFYEIITSNAHKHLKDNGILALEIGYNQAKDVKTLLKEHFKNIKVIKDYSKLDRFILAERR